MSKVEVDRLHQDFAAFSAASEAAVKAEGAMLKAIIELHPAARSGAAAISANCLAVGSIDLVLEQPFQSVDSLTIEV